MEKAKPSNISVRVKFNLDEYKNKHKSTLITSTVRTIIFGLIMFLCLFSLELWVIEENALVFMLLALVGLVTSIFAILKASELMVNIVRLDRVSIALKESKNVNGNYGYIDLKRDAIIFYPNTNSEISVSTDSVTRYDIVKSKEGVDTHWIKVRMNSIQNFLLTIGGTPGIPIYVVDEDKDKLVDYLENRISSKEKPE